MQIPIVSPLTNDHKAETTIKIIAGKVFDPYTLQLLDKRVITVSPVSGLITDVQPWSGRDDIQVCGDADTTVIDLRSLTVLAGFVDVHVHFFLHAYSETSWDDQVTKENLVERTIRASLHAKRTVMAGFTAVRDLGTEGAGDADISLRKCLSGANPLIPGPRYFCANRALVCTGSYGPKSSIHINQDGVEGITGAEVADGVEGCIKAVRRQIGAGADWIKVYANYHGMRSRMSPVSSRAGQSSATFSAPELKAIIDTAHSYGVKVAAHATNEDTIKILCDLGVDSIEHGLEINAHKVHGNMKWAPTLAAYYTLGQDSDTWRDVKFAFTRALSRGADNIVCGGDTGVFAHGQNAMEMQLMVKLGADWRKVLKWATLGGWECVRSMGWEGKTGAQRLSRVAEMKEDRGTVGDNEVPFGVVRKGFAADIIATSGDFERDFGSAVEASSISFVMKGGHVYKQNGIEKA